MPGPLVYFNSMSLDGYIAGPDGTFDWAVPDHEVHSFVNDLVGGARTHLYGRRNYEIMRVWDDLADDPDISEPEREFAEAWEGIDKIVYSTTLTSVDMRRTQLRARFDADEVRRLKDAVDHPVMIGGGQIAGVAARAGLLDEVHAIVLPVVAGGGTRFLADSAHLALDLIDERRFGNGSVYLGYRVRSTESG
ncbi:dihydrofolate reductase family protein [Microbacterium hominis]|uniref:Dihydrofolate reductase family protein n=1 Tax=Microbacterium hominis TaxID=162426 RepID=A0A7D4UFF8_9MICO|nr:dihydrofolate reductase family protein [Microbacterium hominis]QKJ18209.1 dihydrofolate reductase family protein [Microbacterium hominis]